ncbi:MAG TPA: hypothetical protein VLQ67_13575 [Arachnia sp.]|nr:hypothetical protein [Arachnia sp.]
MNEQEFSDALRDGVPPRPSSRGWAASARRRARTRRMGVAAAAVVAVVGMATPLALQLTAPPSVVLATPEPTPAATSLVPDPCRDPLTGAEPLVDGDLPDGATRAWLCGRSDTGSELELVGMPDPLVAHAADAVEAFNALEKSVGVLDCMPNPLDYTVVVEYGDGVHRAVRIAGCGDLRDVTGMFDTFRADGAGYLNTLRDLWAEERAETGFGFTGTALCDASYASVLRPLELDGLARAVVCRADGSAVELDAELTVDLLAALQSGEALASTDVRGEAPLPDLVLLTPTGDPVSLHRVDATYWWDDGTVSWMWGPLDPALEARIVEAQGADGGPTVAPTPTPVVLPDERGDGLVSTVCDDVQTGTLAAEELPGTENLPGGAARAWLCGDRWETFGGVGPVEPLTTDPDRVIDAINELPSPNYEACTEMGGITYHVVLDYPDGTRRVVSAETVNCEWVGGWGNRAGGAQLLQDLLPLWAAQRDANPEPFLDEVSLCSDNAGIVGLNSLGGVERGSLYRGYVCGLPADPAVGDEWIQRELPGDLVLAISQATATPDDQWNLSEGGPYLVMLTQHGDPVTYVIDDDLSVRFPDGLWSPGSELAALWMESLAGLRVDTP